MPKHLQLAKLNNLDDVDQYYKYLLDVRKKYINDLLKLMMNASEDLVYLVDMITYFNKEIACVYRVWHKLREEYLFNENKEN